MKLLLSLLALLSLLPRSSCFASESSTQVALSDCGLIAEPPATATTTANFTQQRFIKGLTKPLVSSGVFQLFPGDKIIWETKSPIFSKVTISTAGFEISSTNEGSTASESFQHAQFREISSLLLSLHSLSLSSIESTTLGKKFSLQCFKLASQDYSLTATPKDDDLVGLIHSITLLGRTTPKQISIIDGRGDKTSVTLTDIRQVNEK